jgi:cytochrome P450
VSSKNSNLSSVVTDMLTHSLAQAEMHLALATIFRRFDTELFDTNRKDVDPKKDFFVPFLNRRMECGFW